MSHQQLRMIDANLNRCSEGLRVLEDVARFVVNDPELTERLRAVRHGLVEASQHLVTELLSARAADSDVGRATSVWGRGGETKEWFSSLSQMVIANAKRVEESLRVMEELARLPELGSKLDSTVFAQARFSLYTLERDLVSRVSRSAKSKRICGLYVILDRQFLSGRDEMDVARQVIAGGAKVIQLRDKEGNRRHLLSAGKRLKELCAQNGVLFIINDYLDLAIALDADGIHVGQEDLPLPTVRKQLPIDKLIGCSVNTVPQALKAQEEGADYIAVGSIFPTETKKAATVVGVDIIRELKQKVSVPVVAIGGINSSNIGDVIAAGADAVAVISGILSQEDVLHATEALVAKMSSGDKGD